MKRVALRHCSQLQDQSGKWFKLLSNEASSQKVRAGNGPWNHYDFLFPTEEMLYRAENFFETGANNPGHDRVADEVFNSFLDLNFDSPLLFNEYKRRYAIWDLFIAPIQIREASQNLGILKIALVVLYKIKNVSSHHQKNHNRRYIFHWFDRY